MFNPEFRYLIAPEEEMMLPLIDNHEFAAIITYCINFGVFGSIGWLAYKLFEYNWLAIKYIWSSLWDLLTPSQWIDIVLIILALALATVSGIIMYITLTGIAEVLNDGFTKLKNENNKKNERINALEDELEVKNMIINKLNKRYHQDINIQ